MSRALTDEEYEATSQTLIRLAGLVFDVSRRSALSVVVRDRVERTRHGSVAEYLMWVESSAGAAERQRLLDTVTIQETHFFRNLPQLDALRASVLPELVARAHTAGRPLTIWSAGCSTGEEPYTLAMILLDLFDSVTPVQVNIIATDVSESALTVAKQGIYAGRTIELAEPAAVERWFDRQADGSYSVSQRVRDLVSFQLQNLVTEEPPFGPSEIDLVVCRNVTIYFGRDTTKALVNRFHRGLTGGGYLLLGHAETLWQVSDAFSLVPVGEAFIYRKDTAPIRSRRQPALVTIGPPPVTPSPRTPPKRGVRDVLLNPVRRPRRAEPERTAPRLPVPTPLDDLSAAKELLRKGRYAEASSLAERATAAQPMLVDGYIVEGRALANQGNDDGAIAALRKAVFLEPRAGHAHFLLATTLAKVGDPSGASLSFTAAAETLPDASADTVAELLDGRAVSDLVDLCRQLASATGSIEAESVEAAAEADQVGWRVT